MKRIALVSDIHANIYALKAFMQYLDTECHVSEIWNMGDFIQIGPNPAEVFDIVINDQRFVSIMGNSEAMFFDDEVRERYRAEESHQEWVVKQLGTERMARLKEIPLQRIVEAEGRHFLMVHTRMSSVFEQPLLYAQKTLEEFLADYPADVSGVLIGHTHLPLHAVHWNNKPIINPGSLGCGKDGIARFAILELNDETVNITYKQLKYPKDQVIHDYERYSVPCSEKFIAMFY